MGPIAPKDPVKKRDFYYIMLEKQISSAPTGDGKGMCVLYQSDGRLLSSSRIVGNITDEAMLDLLKTSDGFKKLVYGIGVSMMCDSASSAEFCFQMYGHSDPYVSGTTIRQTVSTDGVEYLIPLNEVDWTGDDKEPGQIRFEFDTSGFMANVNVRFYLNDGFKAPEFEGVDKVDTDSAEFKALIDKSVLSLGTNDRLQKVIQRAKAGDKVNLAFIGGSITQGAGATPINTECYTYKMAQGFGKRYMKSEPGYIKAGVGGTPSELGMLRFDRDILEECAEPDIVVVEFAVNDAGDETNGECFESLVRKALNLKNKPAVLLIFSVFADDYNLEERLFPIGKHYGLPMVSAKSAVTEQFYKTKETGRVLSKSSYFYDCYHPTNLGHTIMAEALLKLCEKTDDASEDYFTDTDYLTYEKYLQADFETVKLIDKKDNAFGAVITEGAFNETDEEIQRVERNLDTFVSPQFPYNWKYSGNPGAPLTIKVKAKSIFIITKDSASPKAAKADIYVDGDFVKTVNPRDVGWVHCNAQLIFRGEDFTEHLVEVKIHAGDEDKEFTVLGFGITT